MRLSEFAVDHVIYEVVMDIYSRGNLTEEQRDFVIDELFEGINGKNVEIQNFIDSRATPLPVAGQSYFPISIAFVIGLDKIDIQYSHSPIPYLHSTNGYFYYNNNGKQVQFPESRSNSSVIMGTFNFDNSHDVDLMRNIIQLTYGDCKIDQHQI